MRASRLSATSAPIVEKEHCQAALLFVVHLASRDVRVTDGCCRWTSSSPTASATNESDPGRARADQPGANRWSALDNHAGGCDRRSGARSRGLRQGCVERSVAPRTCSAETMTTSAHWSAPTVRTSKRNGWRPLPGGRSGSAIPALPGRARAREWMVLTREALARSRRAGPTASRDGASSLAGLRCRVARPPLPAARHSDRGKRSEARRVNRWCCGPERRRRAPARKGIAR
jgi:hypothetical protein